MNDPKLGSEGIFICGACDERFQNDEEMTDHISNVHDNAKAANESVDSESGADSQEGWSTQDTGDNDVNNMFNSEDDKDLNEAFVEIYKELASQEEAPESAILQQKVERFKVLIKK